MHGTASLGIIVLISVMDASIGRKSNLATRSSVLVMRNSPVHSTEPYFFEERNMGTSLKALLPSASTNSRRSIWSVAEFIPGLQDDENPQARLFQTEHSSQIADYLAGKRLGSPVHYRFYFALTGPRTVLPDDKVNALKQLAGSDIPGLSAKLIDYIRSTRSMTPYLLVRTITLVDSLTTQEARANVQELAG